MLQAMKYQLHIRSQHAKTGGCGYRGPDTYVAVTCAPDDVEVPESLNRKVLLKRGIGIVYFGDGYRAHDGPRSMLGKAIGEARAFIKQRQVLQ